MELMYSNNEVADGFPQNENPKTQRHIVSNSSNMKIYKKNFSGIKYGLSELSNDKTYLETDLPARKRLKPDIELFIMKYPDKSCKAVQNDEFSKSGIYSVSQSNILANQLKFDSSDYEKKSENHNFESHSETEFDDEVNKCYELLNLDVPRMKVVSTTDTKIANDAFDNKMIEKNRQIYKCETNNHNDKSSDTLYLQPNELAASLETMLYNDVNLATVSSSNKLKMQDELQIEKEKKCKDNINFKDESNSVSYTIVTSNSFLTKYNENCININDKFFHNEMDIKENLLAVEFRNDKNNSTLKVNNNLNLNNTTVRDPNIFISEAIQNCDNKNNIEHLDLTVDNTLNSDTLKLKETNQNISQCHLDKNMDKIDASSAIDDSDGILSLHDESDIDFGETEEEISKTNLSESTSAILEATSKKTVTVICTSPEVKKESNLNEKNDQEDVNQPLDNNNCELSGLDCISDFDCNEDKSNFDTKVDDSFVSEYEISLLEDDGDSILSEESLDSEYEISLLEDDINDDSQEKSDNNVGSNYLSYGDEKDEKIAVIPQEQIKEQEDEVAISLEEDTHSIYSEKSLDSDYEISLLEDDINDEGNDDSNKKSDNNVGSNYLSYGGEKDDKIAAIPQVHTKEQDEQTTANKVEISLAEDTNSTLKEESPDSDYEVSLLEDDINDDSNEKSDNVGSNYLSYGDGKDKIAAIPQGHIKEQEDEQTTENKVEISLAEDTNSILEEKSLDSDYEVSLIEEDTNDDEDKNDSHEKSDFNVDSNYLPNGDEKLEKITAIPHRYIKEQENKETTDNDNLPVPEIDKKISNNKIYSESISKKDISNAEKISSDCQKNKVADETDSNVKISAQKEERQASGKVQLIEYTNDKTEQNFRTSNSDKIILNFGKSTLKYEEPDNIKKESTKNSKDSNSLLKYEINNESQTQNKVILNNSKFKNTEEKTVSKNKHLADSACTKTAIITNLVKTESVVPDINKSKQNIKGEFQPSNKVEFHSKLNETKKSEEKVLISNTNKQLTESSFTDKEIEKKVKTDLGDSGSNESKQDVKDIIPDYYEEEKEDLINPGWNKIKELSTDEERYQQVRNCWKSKTIPNPFKNLTYYSYRKHKVNCREDNTRQTKQHKRHASSNLKDSVKRSRSCTYIFDDRIKSIEKEKEMKTKTLHDKMNGEVSRLNELHLQEEMGIQNFYGFGFDPRRQSDLNNLSRDFQLRISSVTVEYEQRVNDCYGLYATEINKLKNNRNEVLQFYSFYKGLNKKEYKDPTILTNAQMQELEEIEEIYSQMKHYYR